MDDTQTGVLVLCIVILLVVLVNFAIIKRFRGKKSNDLYFLSKTLEAAKDPWKKDNQDLDELSRLVEKAKKIEKAGRNIEEINQDNDTSNL